MSSTESVDQTPTKAPQSILRRIGPGLITACVVIGPGSILTSSKVGATQGYAMSWVVVAAVVFMMVFLTLGAKLGVVASKSPGRLIAERAGNWLAVMIGFSVFFISAAFQFGNNLGVYSAFMEYKEYLPKLPVLEHTYVIVLFNILSIAFLFAFRNLYRAVEYLMMTFVGIMLVSFAINLFFAQPSLTELLRGLVPPLSSFWQPDTSHESPLNLSLLGLVGTTFVVSAAFYQSYLVRQKGWGRAEVRDSLVDARVGAIIMALITWILMSTAAAELRDQPLNQVGDVAAGLRPAFGALGHSLFCLGLFAAAYSSFTVNSMVGGFILSDGLRWGSEPHEWWPRLFTAAVLLVGMTVALLVITLKDFNPVPAIVAAQAVTVVASPLIAATLLWLTNCKDIMGEDRNGSALNLLAGLGVVLLVALSWYTATVKIPSGLEKLRNRAAASITTPIETYCNPRT